MTVCETEAFVSASSVIESSGPAVRDFLEMALCASGASHRLGSVAVYVPTANAVCVTLARELEEVARAFACEHPVLSQVEGVGAIGVSRLFDADAVTAKLKCAPETALESFFDTITVPKQQQAYREWAAIARTSGPNLARSPVETFGRMGTAKAMRAVYQAIARAEDMIEPEGEQGVRRLRTSFGLGVELRAETEGTVASARRSTAATRLAVRLAKLPALSLKVLLGSYIAWEQHSPSRGKNPDEWAEISVSTLMKASGFRSHHNSQTQQAYIDAFLPLTHMFAEVPIEKYRSGKYIETGSEYERLITTKAFKFFGNLFADDDGYRGDPSVVIKFQPAGWWHRMMQGRETGSKRFESIPAALLEYEAPRDAWALWLGVYWLAHIRTNRERIKKGLTELRVAATELIEANGLTLNADQRGRVVPKLIEAHERLVRDGIIPAVRYEDPEPSRPKRRIEAFVVVVTVEPDS